MDILRPSASCHVACRQPLPLFPHISRLPVVSFHDCISLSGRYPFRPAGTKNPLAPSSIRKYGSPAQGDRRKRGAVRMDSSSLPSCSQQAGTLIADGMTRPRWCVPATTVLGNVCPQDDCVHSRPSRHTYGRRKDSP